MTEYVLPHIKADDYEEFRQLIRGLPAAHEDWRALMEAVERRIEKTGPVRVIIIRLEDFRAHCRAYHKDTPTMDDLMECADAIAAKTRL
jgi:hypothetical protein